MKNLILTICIIMTLPAFSACLVNEVTCKVGDIRQPLNKVYNPGLPRIKEITGPSLKQYKNDVPEKQLREFSPVESDFSYNTSCQFGVCNNSGGAPKLFNRREKE